PRNSLTVITGLSGSGKSSLAFDTLYAEGQRRYVESLSAYARQFLDQMQKPDVRHIEGLSPAIAIEQKTTNGNPRSIGATVTEIHDYLRLLYGAIARAHCPKCGKAGEKQSAEQIVETISAFEDNTQFIIYAPVVKGRKGRHESIISNIKHNGFARIRIDGKTYPIEEIPSLEEKKKHSIDVVIDRLVNRKESPEFTTRLTDSVELGLKTGNGMITVEKISSDGNEEIVFSEKHACKDCSISFDELRPRSFSFNSPFGACEKCAGLGSIYFFDEDLVIPDKSLPLRECVHYWRRAGHNAIMYYNALMECIAAQYKVDLDTPFEKLPAQFKKNLLHGFDDDLNLPWRKIDKPFEGVLANLQHRLEEAESDEQREKLEAYQSYRICPDCHGARLNPVSRAATVAGKTIMDVMAMSVKNSYAFFKEMQEGELIPQSEKDAMKEVLKEIVKRLGFLNDVGLDYLTLDRSSSSLSGGEMQRIRLATQIGSALTGVLYVLDEPTIGLHPRDNERLIAMLKALKDRGNTVV
ncbi:MAG: excinuclease ABC subunit UvrA, partial [Kiritimatiellae bacterium]|nr:excinuclease ABC subunit UvrA [Kiritimatiellia bacterium]